MTNELLIRQFSAIKAGDSVSLFLVNGNQVNGKLVKFDSTYITLLDDSTNEVTLIFSIIAGVSVKLPQVSVEQEMNQFFADLQNVRLPRIDDYFKQDIDWQFLDQHNLSVMAKNEIKNVIDQASDKYKKSQGRNIVHVCWDICAKLIYPLADKYTNIPYIQLLLLHLLHISRQQDQIFQRLRHDKYRQFKLPHSWYTLACILSEYGEEYSALVEYLYVESLAEYEQWTEVISNAFKRFLYLNIIPSNAVNYDKVKQALWILQKIPNTNPVKIKTLLLIMRQTAKHELFNELSMIYQQKKELNDDILNRVNAEYLSNRIVEQLSLQEVGYIESYVSTGLVGFRNMRHSFRISDVADEKLRNLIRDGRYRECRFVSFDYNPNINSTVNIFNVRFPSIDNLNSLVKEANQKLQILSRFVAEEMSDAKLYQVKFDLERSIEFLEKIQQPQIGQQPITPTNNVHVNSQPAIQQDKALVLESVTKSNASESSQLVVNFVHGRIESYAGFNKSGVIVIKSQKYAFDLNDVTDDVLKRKLKVGDLRAYVTFVDNGKSRAINIRITHVDNLLIQAKEAIKEARFGDINEIYSFIRSINPQHESLVYLRDEIGKLNRLHHTNTSYNGKVKRTQKELTHIQQAEIYNRNLKFAEAEKELQLSIQKGENELSAIKFLASIKSRQNDVDAALQILEDNQAKFPVTEYVSLDNMRVTFLYKAKRYQDVVKVLQKLAKNESSRDKKLLLYLQEAYCYYADGKYDNALELLKKHGKQYPNNQGIIELIEKVNHAIEFNQAPIDLAENLDANVFFTQLSVIAQKQLKNCTKEGIKQNKISVGNFDISDVEGIQNQITSLKESGFQQYKRSSDLYLTMAWLCKNEPDITPNQNIYFALRAHFQHLAIASSLNSKDYNPDVIRCYCLESLSLCPDVISPGIKSYVDSNLVTLLLTYIIHDDDKNKKYDLHGLFAKIKWTNFIEDAKLYVERASVAMRHLISQIRLHGKYPNIVTQLENCYDSVSLTDIKKIYRIDSYWNEHNHLSISSVDNLNDRLAKIDHGVLPIDLTNIQKFVSITRMINDYMQINDYDEHKLLNHEIMFQLGDIQEFLEDKITHFSYEVLLPLSKSIETAFKLYHAEASSNLQPEISLKLVHFYSSINGNNDLKLVLQYNLHSKEGRASATNLYITVEDDSKTIQYREHVTFRLKGGDEFEHNVEIFMNKSIGVLSLTTFLEYTDDNNQLLKTDVINNSIDVSNTGAPFTEIDNKYESQIGVEVSNKDMFFGRHKLIADLKDALQSRSGGIALYGQKRAGKSSVLYHLQQSLMSARFIVAKFSLNEIMDLNTTELQAQVFLTQILHKIESACKNELYPDEVNSFQFPLVLSHQLTLIEFHKCLEEFTKIIRKHDIKLVVLIDEFTEIYKQIKKNVIKSDFMKIWRGVTDKKYFSYVVVGQDVMESFIVDFGNQFATTEKKRITYLDPDSAKELITAPIGKERFAGSAVDEILKLTAGSPYYGMIFCSRLVEYINEQRARVITSADVRNVLHGSILKSSERLNKSNFDNMLTGGDGIEDTGIDPSNTLKLCIEIAKYCYDNNRDFCPRNKIISFNDDELDRLLEDLVKREVLSKKNTSYRLIVDIFYHWLLIQ